MMTAVRSRAAEFCPEALLEEQLVLAIALARQQGEQRAASSLAAILDNLRRRRAASLH